jgi:hypothetical protein
VTSFVFKTTEFLVFCLPFVKVLVVLGAIAGTILYLFTVRFVQRWLTICTRIAGAVLLLPFVVVLLVLLLMLVGDHPRPRVLVSADSQHIAEYSYEAGFLGRDSTVVTVRKKWSIFPDVAYQYQGPSDWTGTEVLWMTNDRLLVRYSLDEKGRFQQCNGKAAGVSVQCVATKLDLD